MEERVVGLTKIKDFVLDNLFLEDTYFYSLIVIINRENIWLEV